MLQTFKVLEAANGTTGDALGMLAMSPATGQHGYCDKIKKTHHGELPNLKPGNFAFWQLWSFQWLQKNHTTNDG